MLKIQDAGRHLVAGFDGIEINNHLRTILKEWGAGGVILFSRNYESPGQLSDLIRRIRDMAGRRVFIGVDQEGGRVARLDAPFTKWPPMAMLGATGDEELARRFGKAVGLELAAAGIDWNFAPVMDVNSNPENPIIGDRSFGDASETVSKMGAAVIDAMQQAGVMACAKHFPGHGDTARDSHKTLPIVLANEEVLYERELAPFVAAIRADVAGIMPAHVLYPAWDASHPASLSRVLIAGKLRQSLFFDGLVISDDLEMGAVAERYEPAELPLLCFMAGNDFLLACESPDMQEQVVQSLYDARKGALLPVELFTQSEKRIDRAAARFPVPEKGNLTVVGCEEHLALAEEIRTRGGGD